MVKHSIIFNQLKLAIFAVEVYINKQQQAKENQQITLDQMTILEVLLV